MPVTTILFLLLLLGLVYGSFLNVLIDRLPRMACTADTTKPYNLFWPGSHCLACRQPLKALYNIPVLSWLCLRGRAHCCNAIIPLRYPVMELLLALLFVACGWLLSYQILPTLLLALVLGLGIAAVVLFWEYHYAPPTLWYVLLWCALLLPSLLAFILFFEPLHLLGLSIDLRIVTQQQILAASFGALLGLLFSGFESNASDQELTPILATVGAWFWWPGLAILALIQLCLWGKARIKKHYAIAAYPPRFMPHSLKTVVRKKAIDAPIEIKGEDVWHAWEFAWQLKGNYPQASVLQICVPASSAMILESQSLKRYLFSLRNCCFENSEDLLRQLHDNFEAQLRTTVHLKIFAVTAKQLQRSTWSGICLDDLGLAMPSALSPAQARNSMTTAVNNVCCEDMHTHLFRSRCPLTAQPDWASIRICYEGNQIDQHHLVQYLFSYAECCDFHEHCVENIFLDIWQQCQPTVLSVEGMFLRRGGIDICPRRFSSDDFSSAATEPNIILLRQ